MHIQIDNRTKGLFVLNLLSMNGTSEKLIQSVVLFLPGVSDFVPLLFAMILSLCHLCSKDDIGGAK